MLNTESRRGNAYEASCCVCSSLVPAGQGWLYSDTQSRRRNGRFPKKVKCDRCHKLNLANKRQLEALENPKPAARRWSVTDVNRWDFEVAVLHETSAGRYMGAGQGYEWVDARIVEIHLTVNGERVRLAGGDVMLNRQEAFWWQIESKGIGGRELTPAAYDRLVERIRLTITSEQAKAKAVASC